MPVRPVLAAVVVATVGCGGGSDGETGAARANATLVIGASDFAVGTNRLPFLVVRGDQSLVQTPRAKVVATAPDGATVETTATLVPLGPHSHPEGTAPHDHPEAQDLYVATLRLGEPGRYRLRVEPQDDDVVATETIEVREQTVTPPVGGEAIESDTPTLADAPAAEITTARPPDTELLRHSVADSLRAGVPFVLAFATPKYCQTRTCGPTVDVLENVRRRFARSGVRFIHVEIFEGNDPSRGPNRWVKEWRLPSEPWVFLVDGEGTIRAKFEGFVSEDELAAAVRTLSARRRA
jgi:hypothetical protein